MTAATVHLMEREGAWSDDGQAWVAKEHYPTRSAAMTWFSKFTDIPYIEVSCLSRHAVYAPDHPEAAYYDGDFWVECSADTPGAFPVWRCE